MINAIIHNVTAIMAVTIDMYSNDSVIYICVSTIYTGSMSSNTVVPHHLIAQGPKPANDTRNPIARIAHTA